MSRHDKKLGSVGFHDCAKCLYIEGFSAVFFFPVDVQAFRHDSHKPNLIFGMIVMSLFSCLA